MRMNVAGVGGVIAFLASALMAADAQTAAPSLAKFKDPLSAAEVRVKELISNMTLEEKAGQLGHTAPAIPRLGIPEYNWWNEGLHGVARADVATVFPQAIGMAASWDAPLMHQVADVISTEFRAKYVEKVRPDGGTDWYRGLTVWSPNINIFRDPRWGRGQETYGEDPYLTSRIGVAFIPGLQGNDPKYLKTIATSKALRRAQRSRIHAAHRRRARLAPRPRGHLPAGVPGDGHGGEGPIGHVRLQLRQRRARLRERHAACRSTCARTGAFKGMSSPTAAPPPTSSFRTRTSSPRTRQPVSPWLSRPAWT